MLKIIKDIIEEIREGSRVFIYGSGIAAKSFSFYLKKMREDVKLLGFIDSFKGGKCCGYKIYKFGDFLKKFQENDYDLILIASMYYEEIGKNLLKHGIENFALVKGKNPAFSLFVKEKNIKTFFNEIFFRFIKILNHLIPKRKNRFIVVGEYGGNFVGNSKYFYLYLNNIKGVKVYWLTNREDYFAYLKKEKINALFYGNIITFFIILSSEYLIFDNRDWIYEYKILKYLNSKKIQLWHGVGFKYIELSLLPEKFLDKLNPKEKKILKERYPEYDLLITTSEFYAKEVFSTALSVPLKKITPAGYPRNDVFYRKIEGENINTDEKVMIKAEKHKKDIGKTIVFAPTFRDLKMNIDLNSIFDYEKLNKFLVKNKLLFIIKGHSLPNYRYLTDNIERYSNILIYDSKKDAYPLLRITDLLITDYSSIYTDFLHTKKPVLFYPFDYNEYTDLHRQIQFDYDNMTPGPKAKNFQDLIFWIEHFLVKGKDSFKAKGFEKERERILNLAFKYKDGKSSERIYKKIVHQ